MLQKYIDSYELIDLSIVESVKPNKQIIHATLPKDNIKKVKKTIELLVNDIYRDRYIESAQVLIEPNSEELIVDVTIYLSDKTNRQRERLYPLKDIWIRRHKQRVGDYIHAVYTSPFFYKEGTNANQLLVFVTVNTADNYEYQISTGLECKTAEETRTISLVTHTVHTDKPFPKAGVLTFLYKALSFKDIYTQALNNALYKRDNSLNNNPEEGIVQAHNTFVTKTILITPPSK
jgi:hypothetical protein